jgi:hypothetical protein
MEHLPPTTPDRVHAQEPTVPPKAEPASTTTFANKIRNSELPIPAPTYKFPASKKIMQARGDLHKWLHKAIPGITSVELSTAAHIPESDFTLLFSRTSQKPVQIDSETLGKYHGALKQVFIEDQMSEGNLVEFDRLYKALTEAAATQPQQKPARNR